MDKIARKALPNKVINPTKNALRFLVVGKFITVFGGLSQALGGAKNKKKSERRCKIFKFKTLLNI